MNPFLNKMNKPTCVVLCGGLGTRMQPYSYDLQKVMVNYKNKPILHYVVDYWKQYSDKFIFITGYKKEQVLEYIPNFKIQDYVTIDGHPEKNGLADAVALSEPYVKENFIVVLGDCVVTGDLSFPKSMDQGVGVVKNKAEIYRNYQVTLNCNRISKVVEKPEIVTGDLCGMGCYFFKRKVFDFIKETPMSKRTKRIELTDVIQTMINKGNVVKPVFLDGTYINITYPEDVVK
jgi:dTDP-glucose pyrophosphorylase